MFELHAVVLHALPPIVAVAVSSEAMKLTPRTVITEPPEVAEFVSTAVVITGESYVYMSTLVPTWVEMVIALSRAPPAPYGLAHMIFVFDVHDVVWQTVFPINTVGVGASPPKLKPYKVTLEPPVGTRFAVPRPPPMPPPTLVTTGASYENPLVKVPTSEFMVIGVEYLSPNLPSESAVLHKIFVDVNHEVVAQLSPPMDIVEV